MDTTFENWTEWKEKCDLRRCGQDTQTALLRYIQKRMGPAVEQAAKATKRVPLGLDELGGWEWWHMVESHYHVLSPKTDEKKPYKDWLFFRVGQDQWNTQAFVTETYVYNFFLKTVATDLLRHQCRRKEERTSLDEPLDRDSPDGATIKDNTPELDEYVFDRTLRHEYAQIAKAFAAQFFTQTSVRERVGMTAIYHGLPLSAPEVMEAAECKHSVLSTAPKALVRRLVNELKAQVPDESAEALQMLASLTLEALEVLCDTWARSENRCHAVFSLLENRKPRGNIQP